MKTILTNTRTRSFGCKRRIKIKCLPYNEPTLGVIRAKRKKREFTVREEKIKNIFYIILIIQTLFIFQIHLRLRTTAQKWGKQFICFHLKCNQKISLSSFDVRVFTA